MIETHAPELIFAALAAVLVEVLRKLKKWYWRRLAIALRKEIFLLEEDEKEESRNPDRGSKKARRAAPGVEEDDEVDTTAEVESHNELNAPRCAMKRPHAPRCGRGRRG